MFHHQDEEKNQFDIIIPPSRPKKKIFGYYGVFPSGAIQRVPPGATITRGFIPACQLYLFRMPRRPTPAGSVANGLHERKVCWCDAGTSQAGTLAALSRSLSFCSFSLSLFLFFLSFSFSLFCSFSLSLSLSSVFSLFLFCSFSFSFWFG